MATGIHYLKRPCPMYGKKAWVISSNLCESPNYKYGTVYIGFWLSPKSHFLEGHAFCALSSHHNVTAFQFLLKFSPS